MTHPVEMVVLADKDGAVIGTAPKATVHTTDTPLHFAFSCYLINEEGKVLLTRRALGKKAWPGVWTNSMCGHPGPGEKERDALIRRGVQELGINSDHVHEITCVLPDFSYRAVDSSGIVEWEICPVFIATFRGEDINPIAEEVDSHAWVEPQALWDTARSLPMCLSPWMVEQLAHKPLRDALGITD